MTARQLIETPGIKLAAYALALGIAWATLEAKVSQKADKAELQAIQTELQRMAGDVRDVKSILCVTHNADSFCKER